MVAGDRIISIDGDEAGALTLEVIRARFKTDGKRCAVVVEHDGQPRSIALVMHRIV
jgi:hypothetical protein